MTLWIQFHAVGVGTWINFTRLPQEHYILGISILRIVMPCMVVIKSFAKATIFCFTVTYTLLRDYIHSEPYIYVACIPLLEHLKIAYSGKTSILGANIHTSSFRKPMFCVTLKAKNSSIHAFYICTIITWSVIWFKPTDQLKSKPTHACDSTLLDADARYACTSAKKKKL